MIFLADPGKARGCSRNTVVIYYDYWHDLSKRHLTSLTVPVTTILQKNKLGLTCLGRYKYLGIRYISIPLDILTFHRFFAFLHLFQICGSLQTSLLCIVGE